MARKLFRNCDPPTWTTFDDIGLTATFDQPVLTVSLPELALRQGGMERIINCADCGGLAFEAGTYDETEFLVTVEVRNVGGGIILYEVIPSGETVVVEFLPFYFGQRLIVTVGSLSATGPAATITVEVSRF
jgi:hypothetical protein